MTRTLVKILYITLLFLVVLAGSAAFLLSTTAGLHAVIKLSQLYLPGTLKIHQLQGTLLNNFTVREVEYQNQTFKVTINQLDVQWHPTSLRDSQLLTAQWLDLQCDKANTKLLNSSQGRIVAKGILPNLNIILQSKMETFPKDRWQMDAKIQGTLPWKWNIDSKLSQSHEVSSKHAGLYTNLTAKGVITAKNRGNLLITISPGFYQIPKNGFLPIVRFKDGFLRINLSPKNLQGVGQLALDESKNLKLHFQLPHFALNTGLKDSQPINGELSLEFSSLDFLNNLSSEINKLKGQLIASLKTKGTLGKMLFESQLTLSKTSLSLPKLGLNLDTVDVTVHGKNKHWDATGAVASAGHDLKLKGKGDLSPEFMGDFSIEGTDFPFMKTSEYQINISPQLKLHLTPTTRYLSGTIQVPSAEIKLQTFHNSLSLPDDVVYKHKEQTPPFAFNSSMDISIEMGKDVAINMKGLKGHLGGKIQVKQMPQGAISAYGELSVKEGTYKAYGQDLAITQGQLIFTGGPINNPGINLRAVKKINNTPTTFSSSTQLFDFNTSNLQSVNLGDTITLGVEVTGRLTKPTVQLFSTPAILSQADILSMLVLGRPANQANKAGGQLILAAISSMNLGSGANSFQLWDQLKQSSGIDFNVQTNSNYNQLTNTVSDSTAFVVGKSLSKRLYLSYNIGLSQTDTNMLTLKYLLNKFFSIQVSNSDTSSAIDFLYTSNKKNKRRS